MVIADMVKHVNSHSKIISVICVQGDTQEYPKAMVKFKSDIGTMTHLIRVVPHLVQQAIIGRDFPKFGKLRDCPGSVAVAESEGFR